MTVPSRRVRHHVARPPASFTTAWTTAERGIVAPSRQFSRGRNGAVSRSGCLEVRVTSRFERDLHDGPAVAKDNQAIEEAWRSKPVANFLPEDGDERNQASDGFPGSISTTRCPIRFRQYTGSDSISERKRQAIGCGRRFPCSHDRTVLTLTPRNPAITAWLAPSSSRTRLTSPAGKRAVPMAPCRYGSSTACSGALLSAGSRLRPRWRQRSSPPPRDRFGCARRPLSGRAASLFSPLNPSCSRSSARNASSPSRSRCQSRRNEGNWTNRSSLEEPEAAT